MKVSLCFLLIILIQSSNYSFNINPISKKLHKKINPISDNNLLNKKKPNNNTYEENLFSQLKDKQISYDDKIVIDRDERYTVIYNHSYKLIISHKYFTIIESSKNNPIYINNTNIGEIYINKGDDEVYINPYKNLSKNDEFNVRVKYLYNEIYNISFFFKENNKIKNQIFDSNITIFRNTEDSFFYFESYKNVIIDFYLRKYSNDMFYDDIIHFNSNDFKNVKDNLIFLEKNTVYILIVKCYSCFYYYYYYILPKLKPYTHIGNYDYDNIALLEPNKTYHLEFNNSEKRLIKYLEYKTNSNIKIKDGNKEIILNKNNQYFEIINNTHIDIISENSITLIKVLYDYSSLKQINITGFISFNISQPIIINCIDLNQNANNLKVLVEGKIKVQFDYSIYPYMDYDSYEIFSELTHYYSQNNYYEISIPKKESIYNETFIFLISPINQGRITIDYQTNFDYKLQIIIPITLVIGLFSFFILLYLSYYKKSCFKK